MATRLFILVMLISTSLYNPPSILPQRSYINEVQINYTFNAEITVRLLPKQDVDVKSVTMLLQNPDQSVPQIIQLEREEEYFGVKFSPQRYRIQPFSYIDYWFTIEYDNNKSETTDVETFFYYDNRIDWRKLEYGSFRIFWSGDDQEIAQKVLDSAQQTVSNITNFLNLNDIKPINIFVYIGESDIFSFDIFTPNDDVVAASTIFSSRSIILHIPEGPDKYLEVQRQTPHEIAHILLADYLGDHNKTTPKWLHEGFASYHELLPNPDYPIILRDAYENDYLIPISQLCVSFPVEKNNLLLSYAESYDLIIFIVQYYGTDGLKDLIDVYRSTTDCSDGVQSALGIDINQLNQQWISHTYAQQTSTASFDLNNVSWVILLFIIILPILLSGMSMFNKNSRKGGKHD